MSEPALHLEIRSIRGPATIQDGGRSGHMAQGLPVGGALCPRKLALANRSVGNRWSAPAIEAFGAMVVVARGGAITLSLDGVVVAVGEDEELEIPKPRSERLIYLAAGGGFDVPRLLGGCGTFAVASLGGFEGRALRRGDRIPLGGAAAGSDLLAPQGEARGLDPDAPIRVVAGPDLDRFAAEALAVLCSVPYEISPASDRVGTRLDGPALARLGDDTGTSLPMVRGAIQVARGGVPIVFGPDHPITGGYPILAAVIRADWGRLEALPLRSEVRFSTSSLEEARETWRWEAAPLFS